MKLLAFLGFLTLFGWLGSDNKNSAPQVVEKPLAIITDTINFIL